jgi:hypothetical protein
LREFRRRDIGTWRGKGKGKEGRGGGKCRGGHHFIINEDCFKDK